MDEWREGRRERIQGMEGRTEVGREGWMDGQRARGNKRNRDRDRGGEDPRRQIHRERGGAKMCLKSLQTPPCKHILADGRAAAQPTPKTRPRKTAPERKHGN